LRIKLKNLILKLPYGEKLFAWLESRPIPQSTVTLVTAAIVGVGAGFGAVGFRRLIEFFQTFSYDTFTTFIQQISPFQFLLIPAIGGAIFGPIIYFFAPEAKGHGVPEVMESVALHGGRIRPQVTLVKALSSAICIGTGGSIGREGPIAQIGSAWGSTLGQFLRLSSDGIRNLVACGAAGGIAATFNAPISGAIFSLEIILGRFQVINFVSVVISAVLADVIARIFEANPLPFNIPQHYTMGDPIDLLLYALLGLLLAFFAVGFTRLLYLSEDLWDGIPIPEYVKPILGGLLLGTIGLFTYKLNGFPRVFGIGYDSINQALQGMFPLGMAFFLFLLKMLATVITLGSGGSGGIFSPSLFMGAMFGLGFGHMVQLIHPSSVPPGAFAMVSMAGFFGGSAHAPLTAILILFEMTQNYNIILPLMLTTVIATVVAQLIDPESIYTLKLTRRGLHLQQGQDIDVMQGITVGEAMSRNFEVVHPETSIKQLSTMFEKTHQHGFPVVDDAGALLGIVSVTDLERAVASGQISKKKVKDIATVSGLLTVSPEDPMWKALNRMSSLDIGIMPVVQQIDAQQRLVGIIRRSHIIRAYNLAIAKRAQQQYSTELLTLGRLDKTRFNSIVIPKSSAAVGEQIRNLPLPENCLVVSIRRKGRRKLMIAHGYTTLQSGDQVTVIAEEDCMAPAKHILTDSAAMQQVRQRAVTRHREIFITAGISNAWKYLRDVDLPPDVIVVNIRRGDQVIVPHGDTQILPGDVIDLFGKEDELDEASSEFLE
jgi:CIC family chloride channel protein